MIGGMVGIAGHLTHLRRRGRDRHDRSSHSSIRKPGYYSGGIPVDETTRFRKNAARFHRLDELARAGAPAERGEAHGAARRQDQDEDE